MLYSPSTLGKIVYKNRWLEPPHIKFLDELLLSVARRELRRLIVNIPPRFGKSELISKLFPFWYIGNITNHTVMVVSYQNNLAKEWGKRIRELIAEHGESLFSITLDRADRSASSIRVLPGGGKIYCVGAGGLLTGLGANAIVIDDPIKNQKEALSLRQRDSLWDWFKATLFTRLEPDGVLLLVMTRWHDDDLVGRILKTNDFVEIKKDGLDKNLGKENPSLWFLVKIPVIAGQEDPLGRKPGELLWESRFGRESVLEQKKILGNFWFSALYQQEPIFETGRVFKKEKFRYFSVENNLIIVDKISNREVKKEYHRIEDCSIFATVDLAIKEKEQSDYTVGVVFAVSTNREIFILEVERKKIEAAGHLDFLLQIFSRWKPTVIGIESVQYQYSLIQMARRRGLPVKELRPDKDKFARALAVSALIESEMVYLQRNAYWLDNFEQELLQFPYGNHDDQVDAVAYIPQIIGPLSFSRVVGVARKSEVENFKFIK